MSFTVENLLKDTNITITRKVKWNEEIWNTSPGIYIVSMSDNPNENNGSKPEPHFSIDAIKEWIKNAKTLKLDRKKPKPAELVTHLSSFWLAEENILYIGATERPLEERLKELYRHKIGKSSPHSGGQWLKALDNLDRLWIYIAECEQPKLKESILLYKFMCGYESIDEVKSIPLPYANLKIEKIHRLEKLY
jgi:hypothetical protein